MTRAPHAIVFSRSPGVQELAALSLDAFPSVRTLGCSSDDEALAALERHHTGLLVVDLALPGDEVEAVLARVETVDPAPSLVFLGDPPPELRTRFPAAAVVPMPVTAARLGEAVESLGAFPSGAVPGAPFSLTDYLQLAALGQHSVRFEVVLENGDRGVVDVVEGTIRHAECGAVVGLDALRSVLSHPVGSLNVRALRSPKAGAELELSVPRALLDLAVESDGGAAAGSGGDESPPGDDRVPSPEGFEEIFAAGIEASLAGDHRRAREFFLRALELSPGEPRVLHNLRCLEQLTGEGTGGGENGSQEP